MTDIQKGIIFTALLFIPLACSNFNSVATQTAAINYYSTEAMSAAQTMVYLTQSAIPTATPEPTRTLKPPLVMKLYDDFENRQFEGSTSSIKWRSFFNSRCKAYQKDGSLIIADTYKEGDNRDSHCDLIAAMPMFSPYDEIGSFSANLMAKKQNGDSPFFWQTISITTYDIKNGIAWNAECGLKADELGFHFIFRLFPADLSQMEMTLGFQSAQYDTWYKVEMELDARTNTIKCFINENLFHETIPPRLDEIRSSDFFWSLHSFATDKNPYTELWFGDVYRSR